MDKTKNLIILILVFSLAVVVILLARSHSENDKLEIKLKKGNERISTLELQITQNNNNENQLYACLDEAQKNYEERWDSTCRDLGKELNEDGSCLLPSITAQNLDAGLKTAQDLCVTLYK